MNTVTMQRNTDLANCLTLTNLLLKEDNQHYTHIQADWLKVIYQ